MALLYLDTDATGSSSGTSWADAFQTVDSAMSALDSGDDLWVAHAMTGDSAAGFSWTFSGNPARPNRIIAVNKGTNLFSPMTTPMVATTTQDVTFTGGHAMFYGIYFDADDDFIFNVDANGAMHGFYDSCTFEASGGSSITMQGNRGIIEIKDSTIKFTDTGRGTASLFNHTSGGRDVIIDNVVFEYSPSATVTSIWENTGGYSSNCIFKNCDLTPLKADALVRSENAFSNQVEFYNCRLPDIPTHTTTSVPPRRFFPKVMGSTKDSDNKLSYIRYDMMGGIVETDYTTYRLPGASYETDRFSWKVTLDSDAIIYSGTVITPEITAYIEDTLPKTVRLYTLTDNWNLHDDNAWIEVNYPGDSNSTKYSVARDRISDVLLSSSAQQTTGAEVWTAPGVTTQTKQVLEVSFTPARTGPIYVTGYFSEPNLTLWVDPRVVIVNG